MTQDARSQPANFRTFDQFAKVAATAVLAVGSVALLGWILDFRTLQSFYPGWVTMKANTAFGLVLAGGSLLAHSVKDAPIRGRPWLAHVLGAVVSALGAATVAQYAFGVDLGIDQLLFSAATETPPSATPGRMSALTAVAFILIGGALALVGREWSDRFRPTQALAIATAAVGLAALFGFVYGAIPTRGSGHGIQIAFHTAISIVLLAAGTLALEARYGWIPTLVSRGAGGQLARRLLPLAFLVPLALGALQSFGERAGLGPLLSGPAVVAVLTMLAFAAVIWQTARAINHTDAQWQVAEQERITMAAKAEGLRASEAAQRAAREAAERAASEKEDALLLLNLVLDSSPVGFALFDQDLRVRRANRAFTDMTGAPVDDQFVWAVDEVIPEHAAAIAEGLRQVLATGVPVINAERTGTPRTQGGPQRWLTSKYPVRSHDGGIIGVGMTLVETTERWELEEQLRQAQKMEAIGQLAGGVAHDFNNVLTAIKSFGELVASALKPESPLQEDVLEIITAADRGTALTRQLLAFSRQQRLEPTVVDLNAVAEGVAKLLSRLIGSDLECETVLSPSLGRVVADPGQLEQVIVNLAVNARDAMPGGGTLRIETSNVTITAGDGEAVAGHGPPPAGDYVLLAVSDSGHGMDGATLKRIFEPFFTTKEAGKGTGLGLSTVYGIVAQSSGYVTVKSEIGSGTTFNVYLPRVTTAVEPAAAVVMPVARPGNENSETILLVDDDDAVRSVLVRILTRAGFEVLSAGSAREAESIVAERNGAIHLLMTDLSMPEMNGDELAQRVRAVRPDIRVLYTSGYTDDAVRQRGLFRHGDPFLSKPFTLDGVVAKVREALAHSMPATPGAPV